MKAILLLRLVAAFAYAEEPEKRSSAGNILSTDVISHVHIRNLLQDHGIEAVIVGRVLHSIDVPPARSAEAARLIREDAPKRGYLL